MLDRGTAHVELPARECTVSPQGEAELSDGSVLSMDSMLKESASTFVNRRFVVRMIQDIGLHQHAETASSREIHLD